MLKSRVMFALAIASVAAVPVVAQQASAPAVVRPAGGTADVSRITAGTYAVDTNHTQVAWSLNHLGFNAYHGLFGGITGSLSIDPAKPETSSVSVTIPIAAVASTRQALNDHMMKPDIMDAAAYPTATFQSTAIAVSGTTAKITGNFTLHGVTKPIVLDARFIGAGNNPMNKKQTVGFEATVKIKRSDFGVIYGLPGLGDEVDLRITAAFERPAA